MPVAKQPAAQSEVSLFTSRSTSASPFRHKNQLSHFHRVLLTFPATTGKTPVWAVLGLLSHSSTGCHVGDSWGSCFLTASRHLKRLLPQWPPSPFCNVCHSLNVYCRVALYLLWVSDESVGNFTLGGTVGKDLFGHLCCRDSKFQ